MDGDCFCKEWTGAHQLQPAFVDWMCREEGGFDLSDSSECDPNHLRLFVKVTWDEEMTFVLNRKTAESKLLEITVVENYMPIAQILPFQSSLKDAVPKCG